MPAKFGEEEVKSRFVLFATGIVDESPDLPGIKEAIAKGLIRYCPVCDGYEATDQRIGVLDHGRDASTKAKFLRTYSKDVTLLNLDEQADKHDEAAKLLHEAGVKVAGPVSAIEHSGPESESARLRVDGKKSPAGAGHYSPGASSRFGLLIYCRFGDFGQCLIRCFFFFQSCLEKFGGVIKTQFFRPRYQRAVSGNFVMLNSLGGGEETSVECRGAFILFHDFRASSVIPTIAAHVLPCGFLSMAANTCSSRSS